MAQRPRPSHRMEWTRAPSLKSWQTPKGPSAKEMKSRVAVDMGWGRLIFAHTFADAQSLADELRNERPGKRDIAFYLRDPHVVLSLGPQELFLDPSHTYRLWLDSYRGRPPGLRAFIVRRMQSREDADAIARIFAERHMVTPDPKYFWDNRKSRVLTFLVAQDKKSGEIIGTVTGVDHRRAFNDPESGSSLWCLAVAPQAPHPGVGEALVRHLAEHYLARGRAYMDLSVMHDNKEAIGLYEKLGFQRVPVFCIKTRNPINEPLFTGPSPEAKLNPYAEIIISEARRRGIAVEVIDEEAAYFALTFGGRSIICRESLTQLTDAIAMSRCQDKAVTLRIFRRAGLEVPAQRRAGSRKENGEFLAAHKRLVVKPADDEQGRGITVDVRTAKDLDAAIDKARGHSEAVLLEEYVEGQDLRIIVIGHKVVAGAVRRPPEIAGTGQHTVADLIRKQSRRRAAATGGESKIPLDEETERCVKSAGYKLDSVLPQSEVLAVRKTANLHTGGTIHDVTDSLHPRIVEAAVTASRALNIPVVGLDFIVPDVKGDRYVIIEANERAGLANHEPQPTAERFIDLLFPQTVAR